MKRLVCLLLLSACQATDVTEDTHFLVSDELRRIMQRMSLLIHERELTHQQVEDLRIQHAAAIVAVTDRLVAVTDTLSVAGSGEGAAEFTELSRRLRDEARSLGVVSRGGGTAAEIDGVFRRMESLCVRCHDRFTSL
jgi:hypothetical protein